MDLLIDLDRRKLIPPITKNTPSCVIFQIAICLGFNIEISLSESYITKTIKALKDAKITVVSKTQFTREESQFIARFVNGDPNEKWILPSLNVAFNHLLEFYEAQSVPSLEPDFIVGYKTGSQPLAYDPCMLYHLLCYKNITTSRNMTMNQMGHLLKLTFRDIEQIRMDITNIVSVLPYNELLSLRLHFEEAKTQDIPHPKHSESDVSTYTVSNVVTSELLQKTHSRITNTTHLISRINPLTNEEAIILSVVRYGINLSECLNPLDEYIELCFLSDIKLYIPKIDDIFKIRYITNPSWYDIKIIWTPIFNFIYSPNNIELFAQSEGHQHNDNITYIEYLNMSRVTQTFYMGIHPCMIQASEDVSEISNIKTLVTSIGQDNPLHYDRQQILSFGIVETQTMNLYTVRELGDFFKFKKALNNPLTPIESLSSHAINKLKFICRNILEIRDTTNQPHSSNMVDMISHLIQESQNLYEIKDEKSNAQLTSVTEDYKYLYDIIIEIEKINKGIHPQAQKLRSLYHSSYSNEIDTFLTHILHLGLYMRGWKCNRTHGVDKDKYPLVSLDTQVPSSIYHEVTVNTTNCISIIEKFIINCPSELRKCIMGLPLMIRHTNNVSRTCVILPSSDIDDGTCIVDRIAICRDGITPSSCIRTSSNHFLTSAYYYIDICTGVKPFNIMDMAAIG